MTNPLETPTAPDAADTPDTQLERLLATTRRPFSGRPPKALVAAALVLLLGLGFWFWVRQGSDTKKSYITEPASRGTLKVSVSATGNLQPTNQVDVGSELSGIIEVVYVDDNDQVKKGQLLARLDISKLEDNVAKSRANLAAARAQALQAEATEAQARSNLERYQKVSEISGGKVPSRFEMDAAEAELRRATGSLASAQAAVEQAKAALRSDETNLAKAHIRSPIDGVVLARQVDPGQTVAASFQAPVLFSLAENLAKMELQVDIDEADVGQVQTGQKASFSVDAWPGRRYDAVITRVGYGSQVKDGVVSYPGVLEVDNSDLSLRPGMTGTAEIMTLTRDNALLIPNAALRFTPPDADAKSKPAGSNLTSILVPRPRPPTERRAPEAAADADGMRRIWVLRDKEAVSLAVKTGASDGRVTEIIGGELEAGMEVITEMTNGKP